MSSSNSGAAAASSSDGEQCQLTEQNVWRAVNDLPAEKSVYQKTQNEFDANLGPDQLLDEYGHYAKYASVKKHYLCFSAAITTISAINAFVEQISQATQICCQQFALFQFLLVGRAKFWHTAAPAQLCKKSNTKCGQADCSFSSTSRQCQAPSSAAKFRSFSLTKKQSLSKPVCRWKNQHKKRQM